MPTNKTHLHPIIRYLLPPLIRFHFEIIYFTLYYAWLRIKHQICFKNNVFLLWGEINGARVTPKFNICKRFWTIYSAAAFRMQTSIRMRRSFSSFDHFIHSSIRYHEWENSNKSEGFFWRSQISVGKCSWPTNQTQFETVPWAR